MDRTLVLLLSIYCLLQYLTTMRKYLLLFFLFLPGLLYATDRDTTSPPPQRAQSQLLGSFGNKETGNAGLSVLGVPLYFETGIGLDISNYRDFATSPLIYHGYMGVLPIKLLIEDQKSETVLNMRNSLGAYQIRVGDEETTSIGYVNNIRIGHLMRINPLSGNRFIFKAGGVYDVATIFRLNNYLFNNATGYEIFGTLSGSLKITADLSRREVREIDLVWWKIYLNPRTRWLSFRLDLGIVNSTLRNGYAYIGQEILLNHLKLFDDYHFDLFSGYRLGSRLDYTWFLKNGNGLRFSYIWDAYFSGGEYPRYEMAHHILQCSLLYKII